MRNHLSQLSKLMLVWTRGALLTPLYLLIQHTQNPPLCRGLWASSPPEFTQWSLSILICETEAASLIDLFVCRGCALVRQKKTKHQCTLKWFPLHGCRDGGECICRDPAESISDADRRPPGDSLSLRLWWCCTEAYACFSTYMCQWICCTQAIRIYIWPHVLFKSCSSK